MEYTEKYEKILEKIRESNSYIYGAGYIAELFWEGVEKKSLKEYFKGVIITKQTGPKYFHNLMIIELKNYEDLPENHIFIAVHETILPDIITKLEERGIYNYTWVSIDLIEYLLMRDKPIVEKVGVKNLRRNVEDHLGIAIRWAVIEQINGQNNIGFELYKRAMKTFCDESTARARLQKYIELISSWDVLEKDIKPISIDNRYRIIDGEHRFTLSVFHNKTKVMCAKYSSASFHKLTTRFTSESLLENGFNMNEVATLEKINRTIIERIDKRCM